MPIYSTPITYITSTNDVLCNIVIDNTIAEKIYTIITTVISLFIKKQ